MNGFFKIKSFALALIVLFSTMSFSVEKHFCGEVLMDIAVFSEVETCGTEANGCGVGMAAEDSCCTNKRMTVEGQDELKISLYSLDCDQQFFLKTFTYSFNLLNEDLSLKEIPFEHYNPPLLVSDIQVMVQVFLI